MKSADNVNKQTNPGLPPANFIPEGLKLCYCDLNFDNFIMEDGSDRSSRIIVIDFEHTSWLPYSFLIWELWDKRQFHLEERISARGQLQVNRENIYALHEVRMRNRYN